MLGEIKSSGEKNGFRANQRLLPGVLKILVKVGKNKPHARPPKNCKADKSLILLMISML